jgi:VWFA-related protein
VAALTRQSFTLLDNNVPQPITAFQAFEKTPIETVVVVDALNLGYTAMSRQRGQISKFLRAHQGRLALPTALVIFDEQGLQSLGGPTKDGNALATAFDAHKFGLRTHTQAQGFYGAEERFTLSLSALDRLLASEAVRPGRKLVLWISPGWPLLSGPRVNFTAPQQDKLFQNIVHESNEMREARVTLYAIDSLGVDEPMQSVVYYRNFLKGVSKPSQAEAGALSLQVLAEQSGGLALNSTDVSELLERCEADASAWYEIAFTPRPAEKPDEYHHLEIKLSQPGFQVRTRQGYYAEP